MYFNAQQNLLKGEEKIEDSYQDDFTKLLRIFPSSDPQTANRAKGEMETAIEKTSKLIKLHSITKRPKLKNRGSKKYKEMMKKKEFNEWIDNSYLLMGQAYFYQHKFLVADKSFTHVIRNFSEEPIKFDAYLWLARSYTEQERYSQVKEIFEKLDGDNEFPRKLIDELALVKADFYLRQENYPESVPFLKLVVDSKINRKKKARYKFILAQVLEKTGDKAQASGYYAEVARMNPPYQMEFNARINSAMLYSGQGNPDALKKKLRRMLRDFKNEEYHDQIYYALAQICYQTGEKEKALEYYRLSAAAALKNEQQRILSCITLADIYFKEEAYRPAQNYYDSAMVILPEDYPDYNRIKNRSTNLTELITQLDIVAREDSLQRLAAMDKAERNALIDQWIEAAAEEEERLAEAEEYGSDLITPQVSQTIGATSGSGWYFYNPSTVAMGKAEFQRLWGRRKLEDAWRRKNKSTLSFEELAVEEETPQEGDTIPEKGEIIIRSNDKKSRNYYLQDVPFTDSLLNLSNERLIVALYNAARIYQVDFNDYPKAIETYQKLDERFSDYPYELPVWFGLYSIFNEQKNHAEASRYSDLIVQNYPDSKFAKYLNNPNYFIELEKLKEEQNQLYRKVFAGYQNHEWEKVDALSSQLLGMNPDSLLVPQIAFFRTIARGSGRSYEEYANLLRDYIKAYPESETVPLANDILVLVENKALFDYQALVESGYLNDEIVNQELIEGSEEETGLFAGKFTRDADLMHYFVIAFPKNAGVDENRLKFDIANYNIDHYTRQDFDIEADNLNDNYRMLVVRELNNKENALIYFRSLIRKRDVFKTLKGVNYVNFVASSENFRVLKQDKDFREYLRFYVRNYSRYIGSDVPTDEIASPEEQIAEAERKKLTEEEKGEFVLISPKIEVAKPKKTELFARDDNKQHFFVVAVKEPDFNLKPLMDDFNAFNQSKEMTSHLKVEQRKLLDNNTIVVTGLRDNIEGISYFRLAMKNRQLFRSLENVDYRNFVITLNNVDSLYKHKNLEKYMDFFRKEYLSEKKTVSEAVQHVPVKQPIVTPKKEEKPAAVSKIEAPAVAEVPEEVVKTPEAQEEKEVEVPAVAPAAKEETEMVAPEKPKQPETPKIDYEGPFEIDLHAAHLYALVIPSKGVEGSKVVNEIRLFNQQSGISNVKVAVEPLDDFRNVVKVVGFSNAENALAYFRTLVRNRKIFEPIGDNEYRNFIISAKNYTLFKKDKNIKEYMDFYKLVYLKK